MTLSPRAVVVTRRTELEELLARHGTHGQASFFLSMRGRDIAELQVAHDRQVAALEEVARAVPLDWRRGAVDRHDLPRFLFAPDDVVVVVGQDGLVANVAKYLDGQTVIGIDPFAGSGPGVLVRHAPGDAAELLRLAVGPGAVDRLERRTMVLARTDDGQELHALNEVYVGHRSHQTARYLVTAGARSERQASSGIVVGTGTGATGWCASLARQRPDGLPLPAPTDRRLAWFVREAWPSPTTGTELTAGELLDGDRLVVDVRSDDLVVFGDGLEDDRLTVTWGQRVEIAVATRALLLLT